MDQETAKKIRDCGLQAIEALSRLLVIVKENGTEAEFSAYRRTIGDLIARIQNQILDALYATHPQLDDLQ